MRGLFLGVIMSNPINFNDMKAGDIITANLKHSDLTVTVDVDYVGREIMVGVASHSDPLDLVGCECSFHRDIHDFYLIE